jgi:hypothetical protein
MKHPADRIRAQAFFLLVGLALLGRDLVKIRRWAREARDMERELRRQHAQALEDVTDAHLERVSELQQKVRDLTGPAPEPTSPADGPAS